MLIIIPEIQRAALIPDIPAIQSPMDGHAPMQLSLHSPSQDVVIQFSFADPFAAKAFFRQAESVITQAAGGDDEPF